MNAPTPPAGANAPPAAAAARALRYLVRVPLLLWHLFVPLPLTLLLTTPLTRGLRIGAESIEHRVIRAWSAGLMRVFGFRLRRIGPPLPWATMLRDNQLRLSG